MGLMPRHFIHGTLNRLHSWVVTPVTACFGTCHCYSFQVNKGFAGDVQPTSEWSGSSGLHTAASSRVGLRALLRGRHISCGPK